MLETDSMMAFTNQLYDIFYKGPPQAPIFLGVFTEARRRRRKYLKNAIDTPPLVDTFLEKQGGGYL